MFTSFSLPYIKKKLTQNPALASTKGSLSLSYQERSSSELEDKEGEGGSKNSLYLPSTNPHSERGLKMQSKIQENIHVRVCIVVVAVTCQSTLSGFSTARIKAFFFGPVGVGEGKLIEFSIFPSIPYFQSFFLKLSYNVTHTQKKKNSKFEYVKHYLFFHMTPASAGRRTPPDATICPLFPPPLPPKTSLRGQISPPESIDLLPLSFGLQRQD